MIYEKKRLLAIKLIHFVISAVILLALILVLTVKPNVKEIEIVSHEGYINDYYEYLDETSCEIDIYFNQDVDSGYITVAFYDDENNLLDEQEAYCYSFGSNHINEYFNVSGLVDSYEIVSFDMDIYVDDTYKIVACPILVFSLIFSLVFTLNALTYKCKQYSYDELNILVYAGASLHCIKVDGVKYDEHVSLFNYTPIYLNTTLDNGDFIEVVISLSNKITLKVNNRLYEGYKI